MTVVARRFLARPVRHASAAWAAITDCVCKSNAQSRKEFEKVKGVASALIASDILQEHPLVIIGSGPRVRIYCLYDEDAISGDDKNEDTFGWDPSEGDWTAYLPCLTEEFDFFKAELAKKTDRILCYDSELGIADEEESSSKYRSLTIDIEGYRRL